MVHEHGQALGALRCQPAQILCRDGSARVLEGDAAGPQGEWTPWKRDAVDGRKREAVAQILSEWRQLADAGAARGDHLVEALAAPAEQRWRIPETQRQPPEVPQFAGMPSARGEIVVAVDDGQLLSVEELMRVETVEGAFEEPRIPAIEKVAGDDQVIRRPRGDAIELAIELDRIALISQMEV